MAEKKVEVFYQGKGEETWRQVESAVARPPSARQAARALLAAGDVAAARAIARMGGRSAEKEARGLTPEEVFERDMARAVGAWERFVEIEMKRIWRGTASAFGRNRDRNND